MNDINTEKMSEILASCLAVLNGVDVKNEKQDENEVTELKKQVQRLQDENEELKSKLEAEQEWMPAKSFGTKMSQDDYDKLAKDTYQGTLSDDEAKEMIRGEFGFEKDKIEIVYQVETYEKNRHGKVRSNGMYTRKPQYVATDWNYIRFNCCGIQYEMINGDIELYED